MNGLAKMKKSKFTYLPFFVNFLPTHFVSGMENYFYKYSRSTIDSLGTRYDYGSLMHYGRTAFSKNGRPTIVPKRSGVCN